MHNTRSDTVTRRHFDAHRRQRTVAAALLVWALGYAAYRAYYAAVGHGS